MSSYGEESAHYQRRQELCKKYGVDSKKVEDVYSKIAPLLRNIMTKRVLTTLLETTDDLKRGVEYYEEIRRLINSERLTPKQKSLLELFCYLELSEGLFSEVIQSIAFVLIENDHDIYDPQRMKFVKSYKELDEVSLFVKLQFIKEHGLKFVADTFDRELRNSIAHLRYFVEDDGTIIDKRIGRKIEGVEKKMDYLSVMSVIILNVFTEVIAEE